MLHKAKAADTSAAFVVAFDTEKLALLAEVYRMAARYKSLHIAIDHLDVQIHVRVHRFNLRHKNSAL